MPAALGRWPSTISREVAANGGRRRYRGWQAELVAARRARRPKIAKLTSCARRCAAVERLLEQRWSPQQIAARLSHDYPDDQEMRVSAETIYSDLRPVPEQGPAGRHRLKPVVSAGAQSRLGRQA